MQIKEVSRQKKNLCKAIVLIAHILQILGQEAMTDLKAVIETIITTVMADITVTIEKADIKDAKAVTKEILADIGIIEAILHKADITAIIEKADIKDARAVTKEIIAKADTIEAVINNADHNKAVSETITQVQDRDNVDQCSVNLKNRQDRYLLVKNNWKRLKHFIKQCFLCRTLIVMK